MIYRIAILLLLVMLTQGFHAPYIVQSDRPKIAGHRGLPSIFPENTKESFMGAMYQGADFIELDVVLNKENQLIVSHDVYLSRVSNVAELSQFAARKTKRFVKNKEMDDWWVMDFTLEELQQLKIKQVLYEGRTKIYDNLFTFPTLQDVLKTLVEFNTQHNGIRNPDGNLVGVLLEIKDYQFHLQYQNVDITENVAQLLEDMNLAFVEQAMRRAPIVIMSFDIEIVQRASRIIALPRVQLLKFIEDFPLTMSEVAQYADIAGAYISTLWNKEKQEPTQLLFDIVNSGLLVYGWTFQDDVPEVQSLFQTQSPAIIYQKAIKEMKLDGIITEFADVAISFAQVYKS